jgi:biotin operon repressor
MNPQSTRDVIKAQEDIIKELAFCAHSWMLLKSECGLDERIINLALKLLQKQGIIIKSSLTGYYELVTEEYANVKSRS